MCFLIFWWCDGDNNVQKIRGTATYVAEHLVVSVQADRRIYRLGVVQVVALCQCTLMRTIIIIIIIMYACGRECAFAPEYSVSIFRPRNSPTKFIYVICLCSNARGTSGVGYTFILYITITNIFFVLSFFNFYLFVFFVGFSFRSMLKSMYFLLIFIPCFSTVWLSKPSEFNCLCSHFGGYF